jgi:hypothetical protein
MIAARFLNMILATSSKAGSSSNGDESVPACFAKKMVAVGTHAQNDSEAI